MYEFLDRSPLVEYSKQLPNCVFKSPCVKEVLKYELLIS